MKKFLCKLHICVFVITILSLCILPIFSAQQSVSQYSDSLFIGGESTQRYLYLNSHNDVYVDTIIPIYDNSEDEMREWLVQTPTLIPHIVNYGINEGYGNTQLTNQWKYTSSIYYHYDEIDTYNYPIAEIGTYGYTDTELAEHYRYYTYGIVPSTIANHRVIIMGTCVYDQWDVPLVIDAPNYDIQIEANLNTYRISDGKLLTITQDIRGRGQIALDKSAFDRHPVGGNDNVYWITYKIYCIPYPIASDTDEVKLHIPCDTNEEFLLGNTNIVGNDPVYRYMQLPHLEGVGGVLHIDSNGTYNVRTVSQVVVNVPQNISWSGMFEWIFDSIGAFMNFEIAPNWTLGTLFSILIAVTVAIWALKTFSGG